MELFTYPYRSIKAITNNAVLATLDELGSTERTPLVEFKARWFTPGIGEAPSSRADMFGDSKKGQVVLAVIENGGVLGRVHRIRPKSVDPDLALYDAAGQGGSRGLLRGKYFPELIS